MVTKENCYISVGVNLKIKRRITDYELLESCRNGDEKAFYKLYKLYKGEVAKIVAHILGPDAEAEDIIQEIFLQLYKSLPNFKYQSKFSTWLYRISVNTVLQYLRRRYRNINSVSLDSDTNLKRKLLQKEATDQPEKEVSNKEYIDIVYEVLNTLSPKKRIVFILSEIEGKSPKEIADIVGAPVLTVRTRLFYARKEFYRKILEHPAFKEEQ